MPTNEVARITRRLRRRGCLTGTCGFCQEFTCRDVAVLLDALSGERARRERVEADVKTALWQLEHHTRLYQHAEYDTELVKATVLGAIEDVTQIAVLALKQASQALAAPAGGDGRAEGGG